MTTNPSFPPVGSGPADKAVYAGVGKTADFTVAAVDNPASDTTCDPGPCRSSGMDHFLWRLDSQPTAADGTAADVTGTDSQGRSTATLTVPITNWGVHTLYVAGVDKAGNISTSPTAYTYSVPWNPATTVTPGDISGDGVPDLLATTKTGDLELIPGNTDPAQSAAPAQSGPITTTPPPVTGPAIVSTKDESPDGTGWNNYLIAHRGNLHGQDFDDLFAYRKSDEGAGQLYLVKNDLDPADGGGTYSTYPGFLGKRSPNVLAKPRCDVTGNVPDSRCGDAGYDSSTPWNITQLIAQNYGSGQYPAIITVENNKLWFYQSTGGPGLSFPLLLGDGDWSGQTLIAAGTLNGSPVLWSRDNTTGALYSYKIAPDSSTGLPPLLHPTVHSSLGLTLPPGSYPSSPRPVTSTAPSRPARPTPADRTASPTCTPSTPTASSSNIRTGWAPSSARPPTGSPHRYPWGP